MALLFLFMVENIYLNHLSCMVPSYKGPKEELTWKVEVKWRYLRRLGETNKLVDVEVGIRMLLFCSAFSSYSWLLALLSNSFLCPWPVTWFQAHKCGFHTGRNFPWVKVSTECIEFIESIWLLNFPKILSCLSELAFQADLVSDYFLFFSLFFPSQNFICSAPTTYIWTFSPYLCNTPSSSYILV